MNTRIFPVVLRLMIIMVICPVASRATMVTTLPASLAAALGSSTNRGFIVKTSQASITNGPVANSYLRAYRQINGTLLDTNNSVVVNQAALGTNPDGSHAVDTINFEKDAAPIEVADFDGNVIAGFSPTLFPGIPGNEDGAEDFALEAVTFIALQAGTNVFGISSGADRTDANNDDGFYVFAGANPRSFFGTQVSAAEKNTSSAFGADQHLETQFILVTPILGIYPLRILYWQTGLGANLQFYSIDTVTGARILVNDPSDPAAVLAYTDSNVAAANAPYVAEVNPIPGSAGNSSTAPITALLLDGRTTVRLASVTLSLNGALTTTVKSKTGARTTVSYTAPAQRPDPNNLVVLVYQDSANADYTNTWQFTINATSGNADQVAGQWDFERGDLSPTIGKALAYLDPNYDGPEGTAADKTLFGKCSELGVDLIEGVDANIMRVPGDLDPRIGYAMTHGIPPNGGGTRVNQYTLIMDLMVDDTGPGAASLLRIQPAGASDGDLFWQGNNFGQGNGGYNGQGTFTAKVWHRVVAAYDEAAKPPVVTKYVDGIFQDNWTANQGLDNPRRALLPVAHLFADGTPADERRAFWVNSIQIRAGKMSNAEIEALGGPAGTGIPVLPTPGEDPPTLAIAKSGDTVNVSWPAGTTGFVLESTPTLNQPNSWQLEPGVTNNAAQIPIGPGAKYFRLKK